jgi:hypothetical protein
MAEWSKKFHMLFLSDSFECVAAGDPFDHNDGGVPAQHPGFGTCQCVNFCAIVFRENYRSADRSVIPIGKDFFLPLYVTSRMSHSVRNPFFHFGNKRHERRRRDGNAFIWSPAKHGSEDPASCCFSARYLEQFAAAFVLVILTRILLNLAAAFEFDPHFGFARGRLLEPKSNIVFFAHVQDVPGPLVVHKAE